MKTKGWTKLFSDILSSSVWVEPAHVRLVWITLLALCDADGMVGASVPGLASLARVDLRECEEALRVFESPDPHSRSTDFEGRRLEKVERGWRVLNFRKFRDSMTQEESREYWRAKKAKARATAKVAGQMEKIA